MSEDDTGQRIRRIFGALPIARFSRREARSLDEASQWQTLNVVINPSSLDVVVEAARKRSQPQETAPSREATLTAGTSPVMIGPAALNATGSEDDGGATT